MKNIKFRAFDKRLNRVRHFDLFQASYYSNPDWKLSEPEMFTGLQDTDGKDIYENDFLKDGTGIRQVVWDYEYARFVSKPRRKEGLPFYTHVVGNIHETPKYKRRKHE